MRIHVIFHMTKFANREKRGDGGRKSVFFLIFDDIPSRRRSKKKLGKWETHSHEWSMKMKTKYRVLGFRVLGLLAVRARACSSNSKYEWREGGNEKWKLLAIIGIIEVFVSYTFKLHLIWLFSSFSCHSWILHSHFLERNLIFFKWTELALHDKILKYPTCSNIVICLNGKLSFFFCLFFSAFSGARRHQIL